MKSLEEINPGDIIGWVHDIDMRPVKRYDKLWSNVDCAYAVIDSDYVHTCIACDALSITFMNVMGTFRLHVTDLDAADLWVIPCNLVI